MKRIVCVVLLAVLVGLGASCKDKEAQAELEGVPPTGNKVTISALVIFRIKDGLIVEEIEEADMLGLYQRLGMELKPKAQVK